MLDPHFPIHLYTSALADNPHAADPTFRDLCSSDRHGTSNNIRNAHPFVPPPLLTAVAHASPAPRPIPGMHRLRIPALFPRQDAHEVLDSFPTAPVTRLYVREDVCALLPAAAEQCRGGADFGGPAAAGDVHACLAAGPDPAVFGAGLEIAGDVGH